MPPTLASPASTGTNDAASVGADLLEQASDALTAAVGDGSFLTTLQAAGYSSARIRDRRRRGDASGYRGRCSRGHSHDAKPLCVADAAADRGSDISADRDPRQ